MVAECRRPETGVGPAIASGSHTYSGNCALFPTAPVNSSAATRNRNAWGACVRRVQQRRDVERPETAEHEGDRERNPMSPMRVVMNALNDALRASARSYQ